jgi:hypothetical protein
MHGSKTSPIGTLKSIIEGSGLDYQKGEAGSMTFPRQDAKIRSDATKA